MPEMHLRQPGFTYSVYVPFTKKKKGCKNLKKLGIQDIFIKTNFQHNTAYGDFKDFPRRAASDKVLHDETFNITKNPKYNGHQLGLVSMVYKFFDKSLEVTIVWSQTLATGVKSVIKSEIMPNHQLAKELHNSVIIKFEKRTVHSSFKCNICSADLADMQITSKCNKGFRFLFCGIDVYSKYA